MLVYLWIDQRGCLRCSVVVMATRFQHTAFLMPGPSKLNPNDQPTVIHQMPAASLFFIGAGKSSSTIGQIFDLTIPNQSLWIIIYPVYTPRSQRCWLAVPHSGKDSMLSPDPGCLIFFELARQRGNVECTPRKHWNEYQDIPRSNESQRKHESFLRVPILPVVNV